MYDKELAIEILHQIEIATQKVIQRFQVIDNPNDFADTATGMEKMDAICMMLIVIGESLKNLDKISGQKLLKQYPNVDWKKAKGMRDIITHHYSDIDAETVFFTCKRKIPDLLLTIQKILEDLKS
ncbi:MAG: DUF86 domain-containing protein [Bacteroidetes bacterium]|nr:DUF86 domain-containing protein [Bacteroidota bacterium]